MTAARPSELWNTLKSIFNQFNWFGYENNIEFSQINICIFRCQINLHSKQELRPLATPECKDQRTNLFDFSVVGKGEGGESCTYSWRNNKHGGDESARNPIHYAFDYEINKPFRRLESRRWKVDDFLSKQYIAAAPAQRRSSASTAPPKRHQSASKAPLHRRHFISISLSFSGSFLESDRPKQPRHSFQFYNQTSRYDGLVTQDAGTVARMNSSRLLLCTTSHILSCYVGHEMDGEFITGNTHRITWKFRLSGTGHKRGESTLYMTSIEAGKFRRGSIRREIPPGSSGDHVCSIFRCVHLLLKIKGWYR